jgi:hypothetical protein
MAAQPFTRLNRLTHVETNGSFDNPDHRRGRASPRGRGGSDSAAGPDLDEMIGYYTPEQPWTLWTLRALFPTDGHFAAVAGGWRDIALTRQVKRAIAGAGMEVASATLPHSMIDASDQRNYWSRGWPAVMVGDTAYLRNPNYHTRHDTPSTLDYVRMARVVGGVFSAAMYLAGGT